MTERDKLIVDHLPHLRALAKSVHRKLPHGIEFDDVYGAGTVGLVKAADRFDAGLGFKFWTYAQARVRGEILDHLRLQDHLSRKARRKQKDADILDSRDLRPLSLTSQDPEILFEIPDSRSRTEALSEESERGRVLRQAMRSLPQRKRKILVGYYWRGDSMKVAAPRFGVNESRLSQLHLAAVKTLANHFEAIGLTSTSI